MKQLHSLTLITLAAVSCATMAQEAGRVISSQPIIQQVTVPRQVCTTQQVEVPQQKSGAGAALGAIAGGAMGNAIGKGAGNAAATMLGIVGGAIVGDHIEGAPAPQYQNVQNCMTRNTLENRVVGYNVTYEYNGKQYSTQMQQDPGATVPLQISPAGAPPMQPPAYQDGGNNAPAVVYQQAPVVVQPGVVYAPYYAPGYYPAPVRLNFDFDYWGGRRHWR